MKIAQHVTEQAVLDELGKRLARYRLNRNLTQAELAKEAGVSQPTVVRMEAGKSAQFSSYIRILRALDLIENLESLVPEPLVSPIQQLKLDGKERKRASSKSKQAKSKPDAEWTWKDD